MPAELHFSIVDPHSAPQRDLETEHRKRLHLIVVRLDMTGYRHTDPKTDPDGTCATRLELKTTGAYRLFADFTIDGVNDAPALTLADLGLGLASVRTARSRRRI